eukprot:444776-Pleurochrysis_carterae.AAC.1
MGGTRRGWRWCCTLWTLGGGNARGAHTRCVCARGGFACFRGLQQEGCLATEPRDRRHSGSGNAFAVAHAQWKLDVLVVERGEGMRMVDDGNVRCLHCIHFGELRLVRPARILLRAEARMDTQAVCCCPAADELDVLFWTLGRTEGTGESNA